MAKAIELTAEELAEKRKRRPRVRLNEAEREQKKFETSKKVKELIGRTGLSTAQFAKHYGISKRNVENWITTDSANHREPPEYALGWLERLIDIDLKQAK